MMNECNIDHLLDISKLSVYGDDYVSIKKDLDDFLAMVKKIDDIKTLDVESCDYRSPILRED